MNHHLRVLSVTFAALGLSVGVAACGDDDDGDEAGGATTIAATTAPGAGTTAPTGATDAAEIHIVGFDFGDPLTVPAGTTVTVVNDSVDAHTLTADDGSFSTGEIAPGASATLTFADAGTFTFHCAFHSTMQGSITVTA